MRLIRFYLIWYLQFSICNKSPQIWCTVFSVKICMMCHVIFVAGKSTKVDRTAKRLTGHWQPCPITQGKCRYTVTTLRVFFSFSHAIVYQLFIHLSVISWKLNLQIAVACFFPLSAFHSRGLPSKVVTQRIPTTHVLPGKSAACIAV